VVKLLLKDPRVDPTDNDNKALLEAIRRRRTEVVKLLLDDKRIDPNYNDNEAIKLAVDLKIAQMVELLAFHPRMIKSRGYFVAFERACRRGGARIVGMLLLDPRINVSILNDDGASIIRGLTLAEHDLDTTRIIVGTSNLELVNSGILVKPTLRSMVEPNIEKLKRYARRKYKEVLAHYNGVDGAHVWETFTMLLPPKMFTYGITFGVHADKRVQVKNTLRELWRMLEEDNAVEPPPTTPPTVPPQQRRRLR
jgi:hypothetical protein